MCDHHSKRHASPNPHCNVPSMVVLMIASAGNGDHAAPEGVDKRGCSQGGGVGATFRGDGCKDFSPSDDSAGKGAETDQHFGHASPNMTLTRSIQVAQIVKGWHFAYTTGGEGE